MSQLSAALESVHDGSRIMVYNG